MGYERMVNDVVKREGSAMLKVIPSVCTSLNLVVGVFSLTSTIQGHYRLAFLFIVVAAVFDILDGYLARLLNCTSEYGKQLDSLADLVSFGVAPALLLVVGQLSQHFSAGILAATMFIVCGALRLARFNMNSTSSIYTGLPITAAGLLLSVLSLSPGPIQPVVVMGMMIVLSLLMVSRFRFPSWRAVLGRYKGR